MIQVQVNVALAIGEDREYEYLSKNKVNEEIMSIFCVEMYEAV